MSAVRSGFAALLAFAMLVPTFAHAAGYGQASDDDDDGKAARVRVSWDLNRDGIPDRAEAVEPAGDEKGSRVLLISLGGADGRFQQLSTRLRLGLKPTSVVAGDFNQDGFPDLIVGDEDGTLMLLLGDGTGRFTSAGDITRLSSVASIVASDFNHDGMLDLAVSDPMASSVTLLLGAGGGSFRREWSFPMRMAGTSPHLASADFNGDGRSDLAVVYDNDDEDTYDVMLGDGKGHFVQAPGLGLVRDANAHCAP